MFEAEVAPSNLSTSTECDWSGANSCSPPSAQQACPAAPQSCTTSKNTTLPQTSSSLFRLETESSCMEIEAAQRKLQEIEDRYAMYNIWEKKNRTKHNWSFVHSSCVMLCIVFNLCIIVLSSFVKRVDSIASSPTHICDWLDVAKPFHVNMQGKHWVSLEILFHMLAYPDCE